MKNKDKKLSRREFLTVTAVGGAVSLAGVAALSPLKKAAEIPTLEEILQKHYKEMSDEDKKILFKKLEKKLEKQYGKKVSVSDPPPLKDVEFAMVINLGRCIGCRRCVYACMEENNTSRNPQIQYIRVLKMKKGSVNLETGDHNYPADESADPDYYYMPVQCHQCRKPPCVEVCPVGATWKEKDGIVVVDYNWCIGCRYCEAACPYHARRFNWAKPHISPDELNPDMAYLSNRPRYTNVMEKCTFCLQRTRKGRYTACVEVCPTGSRKFGNLRDPNSEVRKIIEKERVFVLKEELGTIPQLYYVFSKA
jgi:molybdopterin-containing oxidoreductase family iron-sulfur binding subunit